MNKHFDTAFDSITRSDLATAHGGDGWGDYTSKLGKDWKDVKSRWNEALKHTKHSSDPSPGKFAYNYAGAIFNGGKLVNDATGGVAVDLVKGALGKK